MIQRSARAYIQNYLQNLRCLRALSLVLFYIFGDLILPQGLSWAPPLFLFLNLFPYFLALVGITKLTLWLWELMRLLALYLYFNNCKWYKSGPTLIISTIINQFSLHHSHLPNANLLPLSASFCSLSRSLRSFFYMLPGV